SSRMTSPCETRSPGLTLSSLIVPACGAGTSRLALSDSRVISGSSALTSAPGVTWTSTTGTSLKSPMSGTRISTVLMAQLPSQDQPPNVLDQMADRASEARGQRAADHPVVIGH